MFIEWGSIAYCCAITLSLYWKFNKNDHGKQTSILNALWLSRSVLISSLILLTVWVAISRCYSELVMRLNLPIEELGPSDTLSYRPFLISLVVLVRSLWVHLAIIRVSVEIRYWMYSGANFSVQLPHFQHLLVSLDQLHLEDIGFLL